MRALMQAAVGILPESPAEQKNTSGVLRWVQRLRSLWRHTLERDARQIEFHYDLSDDFYALWLDPHRVYSCVYYRTPDMSLAQDREDQRTHNSRTIRLL